MPKTANLYARIEPEVKAKAEGIPFNVRIPSDKPVSTVTLTEEQMDQELEKGYADMLAGRTKPAKMAFASRGSLSKYANPKLLDEEDSAWKKAVFEKYENA